VSGVREGDEITASYTATPIATTSVGNYPIAISLNDPGQKLSNYTLVSNPGTFTVLPAILKVTTDNQTRLYGAANPAFTGAITGVQNGDDITASYTSVATPASPVGAYAVSAGLTDPGQKLPNYDLSVTLGNLVVTPAPLSISGDDKTRSYGAANPLLTGSIDGIKNSDNLTLSFSTVATTASPVASYSIVPALIDPSGKADNYIITIQNGTLRITPASLTISAENKSRAYGATNPIFTATYVGFVNNENTNVITERSLQ